MAETETDGKEDEEEEPNHTTVRLVLFTSFNKLWPVPTILQPCKHFAPARPVLGGLETELTTVHSVLFCLWYIISFHANANALEKEGAYVIFNLQ
jgi:hypothetical protein